MCGGGGGLCGYLCLGVCVGGVGVGGLCEAVCGYVYERERERER